MPSAGPWRLCWALQWRGRALCLFCPPALRLYHVISGRDVTPITPIQAYTGTTPAIAAACRRLVRNPGHRLLITASLSKLLDYSHGGACGLCCFLRVWKFCAHKGSASETDQPKPDTVAHGIRTVTKVSGIKYGNYCLVGQKSVFL